MRTRLMVATLVILAWTTAPGAGAAPGGASPRMMTVQPAPRALFHDGAVLPGRLPVSTGLLPLSAVQADLDGDGAPELIAGLGGSQGGMIAVLRTAGEADPYLLPGTPDFLVQGDFNADGRLDLAAGTRGGSALYFLMGEGQGWLRWASPVNLPGRLTALASGDLLQRDGLADLVLGLCGPTGCVVRLLQSSRGAWEAAGRDLPVPEPVTALRIAPVEADDPIDVWVGAGSHLMVIHGGREQLAAPVQWASFSSPVASLAPGRFAVGRAGVVLEDGSLHLVEAQGVVRSPGLNLGEGSSLLAAKVAAGDGDDLIAVTPAGKAIRVWAGGDVTAVPAVLQFAEVPGAVVPLRANGDGLADLALFLAGRGAPILAASGVRSTFTVTSTADTADALPGDGVCADANGVCTLRASIQEANATPAADAVDFSLGAGIPTITLASPLPSITASLTITGDSPDTPRVEINGNGTAGPGLFLAAGSSGSRIRGLVINRAGSSNPGLRIESADNLVENCWIGLDKSGTTTVAGNAGGGILITGAGATGNLIGGSTAASRNVISHNSVNGVKIENGASTNTVAGNFIGTDTNGAGVPSSTGNTASGVLIGGGQFSNSPASNNTIGGPAAAPGLPPGNVISRNGSTGVEITNNASTGNLVQGNLIGTQANGTAALGNSQRGVLIYGAAGNTIGGSPAAARNVISGHTGIVSPNGVEINQANADNNVVAGNYIGVDITGAARLSNAGHGVYIAGGPKNTTIGGSVAIPGTAPGNVISGNDYANDKDGIQIQSSSSTGTRISGNIIGLNASGTAAIRNGRHGVSINAAANTTVGGATQDLRNVISGHTFSTSGAGVRVETGGANNTVIAGNYIGTDLAGTAAIGNNYGLYITGSSGSITGTVIGGTVEGGLGPGRAPGNLISGNANEGIYLSGSAVAGVTVAGNIIGLDATGTSILKNGANGIQITSSSKNNTIGGSAAGARNVISGNGSLNTQAGISINGSGVTGNLVQGNFLCTDLGGTASLPNYGLGVVIKGGAQNNTIGGATANPGAAPGNLISGCSRDAASAGIQIDGTNTNANLVQGNLIGTDVTGLLALGNRRAGVLISGGAANNTIGGDDAARRNVLSGNHAGAAGSGVELNGSSTTGNKVLGNFIGIGADGAAAVANGGAGVLLTNGAYNNTIGGTTGLTAGNCTGACNSIGNNAGAGIRVDSSLANRNALRGNSIARNAALGIDLGPAGVTPNDDKDPDSGANNLQNFPVITEVVFDGADSTIRGTLNTNPNAGNLAVEVFANSQADPSGFGQGQAWLGSVGGINTDGNGNAVWQLTVPGRFRNYSATATDSTGNTSEFSAVLDPVIDSDGDGVPDDLDCAPLDDQVWALPAEVQGLVFDPAPSTLKWNSLALQAGPGTHYQVMRGLVGQFPVGSSDTETCIGPDLTTTTTDDPAHPAPGAGMYYLARGRNVCGVGTYGSAHDGTPRTSGACP